MFDILILRITSPFKYILKIWTTIVKKHDLLRKDNIMDLLGDIRILTNRKSKEEIMVIDENVYH